MTIPTMLAPLSHAQPSPAALFSEFSESTLTASEEVKDFVTFFSDESTRTVLERARESRVANSDGLVAWKAVEHPPEMREEKREESRGVDTVKEDEEGVDEDVVAVVDGIKGALGEKGVQVVLGEKRDIKV